LIYIIIIILTVQKLYYKQSTSCI